MMTAVLLWCWTATATPAVAAGAAQGQSAQTAEIAAAFPGWVIDSKAEGDLNGDALADLVVTLKRPGRPMNDAEGDAERPAWLAVFFRTPAGKLRLHTKAARAVCMGCGGVKAGEDDVVGAPSIDGKGILTLEYEGGSRDMWNDRFKWRYDKSRDRFALIGETVSYFDTLHESGEVARGHLSSQDVNYLSGKMFRKVAGRPRQTCDVKPGSASTDLAAFDFQKYNESDNDPVKGSCRK